MKQAYQYIVHRSPHAPILKKTVLCLIAAAFALYAPVVIPEAVSLNMNEKLIFDLHWGGIKAGKATMEIVHEGDAVRIISTAHSADWVSLFYTVNDRIETNIIKNPSGRKFGLPIDYRVQIREGRRRRNKEVIFDHEKLIALYIDHRKGKKKEFVILPHTFDPLSSLFHVRTLDIEVGKSIFVDIFDSKRMWNVEVQVLRKERIKTGLGEFDTVVIKPLMKSEGIFNRKGDMLIWLTDDKRHIPVMMKTKIVVGSVVATLVDGRY
jgi:hypothetical protein